LNNFHVLFVDDEEELVSTLVERLEYRGIIADYATNGDKALEKLHHEKYDIIVIDLKLPGLSGEELIHGSFEKPNGVYELLQKPINISLLIKKMKEAIVANELGYQ